MARRRRIVTPRDPERTRIARQTTGRIIFIATLSLLAITLAGILRRWPVARFKYWTTSLFGASLFLIAVKLLDEGLSLPQRRARSQVWANVDALVRDGIQMISISTSRSNTSPVSSSPDASPNGKANDLPEDTPTKSSTGTRAPLTPPNRSGSLPVDAEARSDELLGVLAAFPITLQHHLLGTRALPHSPACDLLPIGYLTSLKRTEARVRFATAHAGPSGSGSPTPVKTEGGDAPGTNPASEDDSDPGPPVTPAKKSNLQMPYPSNLPLSLLRLMEAYIVGLESLPTERGGWTTLQVERALDVIKGLSANLSQAEDLAYAESPVFTLHRCLSIFVVSLSLWLVALLPIWVVIVAVPSAALLVEFGVKPIVTEPDPTSTNHPLKVKTKRMLQVALETCPALARYYRTRMVARLGASSNEVAEFDRRHRRERDEWLPTFT